MLQSGLHSGALPNASENAAQPILVNGRPHPVAPGTTVAELVRALELATERVAIERNGEVVRRADHAGCRLAPGDRVEVVTLVGGG